MARRESVSITLGKVLDQSGYLRDLREERSEEAEGRIENLMELVSAAREYESREPEPSLGGFVDRLSLLSDVDKEEGSREARVLLMTLHSAKGLEFPVVVMAGMEEGLFPHSRASEDEAELEEERRLCYVGITRARSRLVLTERGTAARVWRLSGHAALALSRGDSARSRRAGVFDATARPTPRHAADGTTGRTPMGAAADAATAAAAATRREEPDAVRLRAGGPVGAERPGARPQGQARSVRRGNGHQRRGARRRHEARRAVRVGGNQDPAREIREAGVGRAGQNVAGLQQLASGQAAPVNWPTWRLRYLPTARTSGALYPRDDRAARALGAVQGAFDALNRHHKRLLASSPIALATSAFRVTSLETSSPLNLSATNAG